MPITIYREKLESRMQQLPIPSDQEKGPPAATALQQLESQSLTLSDKQSNNIKPLRRKESSAPLSLYNIGNVPSIKARKLGEGHYARTYLHVDGLSLQPGETEANHYYAVKVFACKKGRRLKDIAAELAVLKALGRLIRHDHRDFTVTETYTDPHNPKKELKREIPYTKTYVVQKYIPGVSLQTLLAQRHLKRFSQAEAFALMSSICQALQALHQAGYAHGDLYDANVMVESNVQATLIDFNFSREFNEAYYFGYRPSGKPGIKLGEHAHYAPECCEKMQFNFTPASDVYALGDLLKKICDNTQCDPSFPRDALQSLIQTMRAENPAARPDLNSVMSQLNKLQSVVPHAPVKQQPIDPAMKDAVITAFQGYEQVLSSYLAVAMDSSHRAKSAFLSGLSNELRQISQLEPFVQHLEKGFKDYILKFIKPDINHYGRLSNLGRGLNCFVEAIKACGIKIDAQKLLEDVQRDLPSNSGGNAVKTLLSNSLSPPADRTLVNPRQGVRCA